MENPYKKLFLNLTSANQLYPLRSLDEHLTEALKWMKRASLAFGGHGISKGYDLLRQTWSPPYPEITGYSLPTLINASRLNGHLEWQELAVSQVDFLLASMDVEGGVNYWKNHLRHSPIIFDTGQVIFGWLALYHCTNEQRFLDVAVKSGNWLVKMQEPDGKWRKYQHLNVIKVIDTRVAWALLELYRATGIKQYLAAAERNLAWAYRHQKSDGWFEHCSFTPHEDPFTHTIAYTAESFFACGEFLNEDRYVKASQKTSDRLLELQRKDGSLASTFAAGWTVTDHSSCLTGIVQMSSLWLRLSVKTQNADYLHAARRALEFVCKNQSLDSSSAGVRGGIPGSHPKYGKYERFKFPGWATKFFIHAILEFKALEMGKLNEMLPG